MQNTLCKECYAKALYTEYSIQNTLYRVLHTIASYAEYSMQRVQCNDFLCRKLMQDIYAKSSMQDAQYSMLYIRYSCKVMRSSREERPYPIS